MASNLIGEAILIIASVIVAGSVAGIVMSKVGTFESTVTSTSNAQKDKMLTKISIVYATNSTDTLANIYVKNVGKNPIVSLNRTDVYFGEIGAVQRYSYSTSGADDTWKFNPSLPSTWQQMETLRIDLKENSLAKQKTYSITIVTPNGVSDDYVFSLP
jgi:archaeal flagellar protein FlaG